MRQFLEKFFEIKERGSSVERELLAGITTFSTMVYIVFVNPQILSQTGMDFGAVMVATILVSFLSTLVMGIFANYPFALAPGMGLNAYFTYSLVMSGGFSWQVALGCCFISGIILLIFTLVNVRQILMHALPQSLRLATAAGIGLFLAFIGLKNIGIISSHPNTLVSLGDVTQPAVLLSGMGLILTGVFVTLGVNGGVLIAILCMWGMALALGLTEWQGILAWPPSLSPTFFQLDLVGAWQSNLLPAIISFVFVAIFDTTGTLLALGEQGNYLNAKGELPRANRALVTDSVGILAGSVLGSSPTTKFLESASGIAVGGRTGLTAIVVAVLFLFMLFFSPLAQSIPLFATAPVLILIGGMMLKQITRLDWEDPSEWLPAFVILITIPLTFSISAGISLGFILYPLIKLFCGKIREVNILIWILALLFALKYAFF